MHDHFPPGAGRTCASRLDARDARCQALVALTALKRLESERGLKVREDTRGQVRRALEKVGIVFLASEQGEGVMLVRNPRGARGASRRGKFGRNMTTP
jgi:hypothetical protein